MNNIEKTAMGLLTGLAAVSDGFKLAQNQSRITIIASTSLVAFLVISIKLATHQIFNRLNWQQDHRLRSWAEWSFSAISATLLTISIIAGLGLASSRETAFFAAVAGIKIILGSALIVGATSIIIEDIYNITQPRRRGNLPNE